VRPGNFEQVPFTTVDPDDQARLPDYCLDRGGWIAGNNRPGCLYPSALNAVRVIPKTHRTARRKAEGIRTSRTRARAIP
jgi:hypothetical protein